MVATIGDTMMGDTYYKFGAERLARTIERKWRQKYGDKCGVKAWAVERVIAGVAEPLWIVQSNLVNGMPPRAETRQAAA